MRADVLFLKNVTDFQVKCNNAGCAEMDLMSTNVVCMFVVMLQMSMEKVHTLMPVSCKI